MAKVESPEFDEFDGTIECEDCPLNDGFILSKNCRAWWYRNGATTNLVCPTAETYAAACKLAEQEAAK